MTRAKQKFYIVGDKKRFSKKNYYIKIVQYLNMYTKDTPSRNENIEKEKRLLEKRI